jgi:hypothetical protein
VQWQSSNDSHEFQIEMSSPRDVVLGPAQLNQHKLKGMAAVDCGLIELYMQGTLARTLRCQHIRHTWHKQRWVDPLLFAMTEPAAATLATPRLIPHASFVDLPCGSGQSSGGAHSCHQSTAVSCCSLPGPQLRALHMCSRSR